MRIYIHIPRLSEPILCHTSYLPSIFVSVLRKEFETPPYSTHIELGGQSELRCHPPRGNPPAKVTKWLRNGVPIVSGSNFIVSSTGHLLILQARLEDTANYSCVASNVARSRTSDPALVTVYGKSIHYADVAELPMPGLPGEMDHRAHVGRVM